MRWIPVAILIGACVVLAGCSVMRRRLLYFPTHSGETNGLEEWREGAVLMGYCRPVENPESVWLFAHGNGGQAADRVYALHAFSPRDAVYIVEYPGYGRRAGKPSKASLDRAVRQAYLSLRNAYPDKRVCVVAESIGSGPASLLVQQPKPPDKLVLVVPFDTLKSVASEHAPSLLVGLVLGKTWDNVAALRNFKGSVDIYGARDDTVIPVQHAKVLAESLPQARFILLAGGHNDWSRQSEVHFTSHD